MLADYHIHTDFSDDSNYPLEEVIKDAIKLNINDICITDHVDYGIKKDWDEIEIKNKNTITNVNYPKYIEDINKMKEKYSKQINIKTGLECGILKKPLPNVDMISIGPDIKDVHTPAEHLSISSVDRMWKFLKELVINIA